MPEFGRRYSQTERDMTPTYHQHCFELNIQNYDSVKSSPSVDLNPCSTDSNTNTWFKPLDRRPVLRRPP